MTSYLSDKGFNHAKHYQHPKTMYADDRIMKNMTSGSYPAVALFGAIKDKITLSVHTTNKGEQSFIDSNGKYYCLFTEDEAKEILSMSPNMFKSRKKFLRDAGLIAYQEQTKKVIGVSTPLTITQWEDWVIQNGFYSHGEWIVQPSSEDFYNPIDIVKVQPTISTVEPVERDPSEEQPEQPVLTEHEEEVHAKVYAEQVIPDGIPTVVKPKHIKANESAIKSVEVRYNDERDYYAIFLIEISADKSKKEINLSEKFTNASREQLINKAKQQGYEIKTIEVE